MKRRLLDLLKGFLMGFDCTIPGFSIGTLAILLNVYERLINDLSDLVHHPLKVIKKDIYLGLGFIIGFIVDILTITYLLTHFPLQTVMFFVGMVFATIPSTYKLARGEKIQVKNIIIAIISCVILVLISLLNANEAKTIELKPLFLIMMFIMGIIGSGSMIIPGISGSLLIMAFGYYEPIIVTMKEVFVKIGSFTFDGIGTYLLVIFVFIVGVVVGVIGVAKLLQLLLNKWKTSVYSSILGLLVASPFAIIYLTVKDYNEYINFSNPWIYIVGGILLVLGLLFGLFMSKIEDKKNQNTEKENEVTEG